MDLLKLAIAALNAVPNWLPVLTSFVAAVIAVLAYLRSAPAILPKAWVEVNARGPLGASLVLHVQNHTDWLVQVHSLSIKDASIELSKPTRALFDKLKPWHYEGQSDYKWERCLILEIPVSPNEPLEFPFVMRLSETSSCTKPSMHLSISTTRRVVRQRKMVIPTIVPKHNEASTS